MTSFNTSDWSKSGRNQPSTGSTFDGSCTAESCPPGSPTKPKRIICTRTPPHELAQRSGPSGKVSFMNKSQSYSKSPSQSPSRSRESPAIYSSPPGKSKTTTLQKRSRTLLENEGGQVAGEEPRRTVKTVIESETRMEPRGPVQDVLQKTVIKESSRGGSGCGGGGGTNKLLAMEAKEREMLQRDLQAWQMARRKLLIHAAKITSRVTYSEDSTE